VHRRPTLGANGAAERSTRSQLAVYERIGSAARRMISLPRAFGTPMWSIVSAAGRGTRLALDRPLEGVMTTTVTGAEQWVRDAVMRQLAWEPGLDATMVG